MEDLFGSDSDACSDSDAFAGLPAASAAPCEEAYFADGSYSTRTLGLLASRPKGSGVMDFHEGVEEGMFVYVKNQISRHILSTDCHPDPDTILTFVDDYCYSRHWMMHIGDGRKSCALENAIVDKLLLCRAAGRGIFVVEMGSYCGYSAVKMLKNLCEDDHLVCVEKDMRCIDYTNRLVQMSQLSENNNFSLIYNNKSTAQVLDELMERMLSLGFPSIDVLFLDHEKGLYLSDLKLFEEAGLLSSGSVVVADNILSFNSPLDTYLRHVGDSSVYSSSELVEGFVEYCDDMANPKYRDGISVSVRL